MQSEEVKRQEALEVSIKEGAAANASVSFGDTYITPAVLALGGNAGHVGIVQASIGFLNPLCQLFGSKLENRGRKKVVVRSAAMQAVTWILMACIPLLAYLSYIDAMSVKIMIILYASIAAAGGLLHPSWFSWMGSLINSEERGRYFSKRSAIVGAVALASSILGALILDSFKTAGLVLIGFSVLFVLAGIFRFVSTYFFTRQHEPERIISKKYELSWNRYLSQKHAIGRFAIGMATFNFALYVASPFFAVYLLEEMKLSYFMFMVVSMGSSAWLLLFLPIVGRISDRYGNSFLLTAAGILFAISPPLWILISSPWGILLGPQLLNGLANAAFNIGFTNYTYSVAKPEQRASAVAHVNTLAGIGILAGSLVGGFILQNWRAEASIFLVLFILAAVCRAAVTWLFLSRIKGEKGKRAPSFNFSLMHPFQSLNHNIQSVKILISE